MEMKNKKREWFNDEGIITTLIIVVLSIGIILGQSFIVNNDSTIISMLSSIINHNMMYLLILVYFVALKFKVGKKYFNYLNIFLVILYFINSITSLLTLIQTFTLVSFITFIINIILVIYLVHTLFRDSRFSNELEINKSPFNEISSSNYFYAIIFGSIILFLVNLITIDNVNSVYLAIVDFFYILLLNRYILLYNLFMDGRGVDNV